MPALRLNPSSVTIYFGLLGSLTVVGIRRLAFYLLRVQGRLVGF